MDDLSLPRNQRCGQGLSMEGNCCVSKEDAAQRPVTSFMQKTDREADMLASQTKAPAQALEKESICSDCALSTQYHCTPSRNNRTFGRVYQANNENCSPIDHVNFSKIQKSIDCFGEELPTSQESLAEKHKGKGENIPVKVKREKKEKKTISSKTFAHGLMDMSLMTSNASQLRSVLSNPDHEFYKLLIWLLIISVSLQILSGIVLIVSDFYKSQIKEKDRQNQKKRKTLNFVALALMTVITSLNVMITAFNTPSGVVYRTVVTNVPQEPVFSSADYQLHLNHTEL